MRHEFITSQGLRPPVIDYQDIHAIIRVPRRLPRQHVGPPTLLLHLPPLPASSFGVSPRDCLAYATSS